MLVSPRSSFRKCFRDADADTESSIRLCALVYGPPTVNPLERPTEQRNVAARTARDARTVPGPVNHRLTTHEPCQLDWYARHFALGSQCRSIDSGTAAYERGGHDDVRAGVRVRVHRIRRAKLPPPRRHARRPGPWRCYALRADRANALQRRRPTWLRFRHHPCPTNAAAGRLASRGPLITRTKCAPSLPTHAEGVSRCAPLAPGHPCRANR